MQGGSGRGTHAAHAAQASEAAQAHGPAPTAKPERAGAAVAASAPASASPDRTAKTGKSGKSGKTGRAGTSVARASGRGSRSTRATLRSLAAASLVTCSLVGVGGLAVSQPEVLGVADPAYSAALDQAVTQAAALSQLGEAAATSASARERFAGAASDLATQIPRVAAVAPEGDVSRVADVAGALSTYTSTMSRASSASLSGLNAATQTYEQQVHTPLQALHSSATKPTNWAPVAVFGLVSLIALGTLVGGAVSLARRTRRVLNVPVTVGIVLLAGVVAGGALTAAGAIAWPAGLAGATLLTGGIIAGVAGATGFMQRLQEYR